MILSLSYMNNWMDKSLNINTPELTRNEKSKFTELAEVWHKALTS